MNVRALKNTMEQHAGKSDTNKMLTSVSHWVKRVFDSTKGQYEAGDITEIDTLQKLVDLGVVHMKKGPEKGLIIAELTPAGKELYMDFVKHGYYL